MKKYTLLSTIMLMAWTIQAQVTNIYFIEQNGFPYLETEPLRYEQVVQLWQNESVPVSKVNFKQFEQTPLDASKALVIWPYGSAMSDEIWPAIYDYLDKGGNILVTGGRMFSRNVTSEQGQYQAGAFTNRFMEQLRIIDAEILPYEGIQRTEVDQRFQFLNPQLSPANIDSAYSVLVMMSSYSYTDRNGSLSSKDGTWYNMLAGVDQNGLKTIPLISEINREKEQFAGGRWLLFNFKPVAGFWEGQEGQQLLQTYIKYGLNKPMLVDIVPEYAFYGAKDKPRVTVTFDWLQNNQPLSAQVEVIYNEKVIQREKTNISSGQEAYTFDLKRGVKDGLYRINLTLEAEQPVLYTWNGFLVGDLAQMNSGEPFGTNSHFITRGGETFPVAGMTYMSSENHRFYFIDPNPVIWDQDFKYMKESGINMIRTGIWTGHEYILDEQGEVNEKTMKAWDAFFMIAKKYDIPVQLNFYHMMPSVKGIDDPYTNPEAYEYQKKYILAFAERYKNNPDIIWDLINEPTYGREGFHFTSAVPTGTITEQEDWDQWLRDRYNDDLEMIATNWNTTLPQIIDENNLIKLPESDMLSNRGLYTVEQKPTMAFDYNLFSQFAYNNWARAMKEIIRNTGSSQLVVTGMDEGGVMNRVFHDFIAEESDFSNLHNWWQLDDLLWDNIMAKSKGIPLLLQEVGNMRFEDLRGHRRLSETALAHSLERKLGYSIGVEAAGYIPWIWNTNIYLFNQNEAYIGLHRGDGTAKKEVEIFINLNNFIHKAWDYFSPANDPEVAVVVPYSLQMTAYNGQAIRATRNAIRTLHYHNRIPAISASEYHLFRFQENPKLAVLPSAQVITEEAWQELLEWVEDGTTLLVTGPIDRDPFFLPAPRIKQLDLDFDIEPMLQHQSYVELDGQKHHLSFYDRSAMQNLDQMIWAENQEEIKVIKHGQGKVIICAYPMEMNNNFEALAALYAFAAEQAGIEKSFSLSTEDPGILVRPMDYQEGRYYFILSETDQTQTFSINDHTLSQEYKVKVEPGRVKMLMIDKQNGEVVAEY